MSYYAGCAIRFSLEQQERMRTIYELHPDYEELRIINPACALKTGHIEQSCVKQGEFFPEPMVDLDVELRQAPALFCDAITNGGGRYQFNPCNWAHDKRHVLPDLNFINPDNGVTTYDLVLISQHILSLQPFTSPFQIIAADANNSGSVTTFDIIDIRKVILGITPNFSSNKSWRYIPKLHLGNPAFFSQFDDGNPFDAEAMIRSTVSPENIIIVHHKTLTIRQLHSLITAPGWTMFLFQAILHSLNSKIPGLLLVLRWEM
jgi:hypothetical protein